MPLLLVALLLLIGFSPIANRLQSKQNHRTWRGRNEYLFALLMKYPDGMDMRKIGSGIIFSSDGYSNNNNKGGDSGTTIITLEIATYIISTVCLIILILLVIQVRLNRHTFILITNGLFVYIFYCKTQVKYFKDIDLWHIPNIRYRYLYCFY